MSRLKIVTVPTIILAVLCVITLWPDSAAASCRVLEPDTAFVNGMLRTVDGPAQKRAALVIGNGNYEATTTLRNPANDAQAVSARLRSLGFRVVYGLDVSSTELSACLEQFYSNIETAGVALLYYAGHGIQVSSQDPDTNVLESRNYMLSVDAEVDTGTGEARGFFQIDRLVSRMRNGADSTIVFLDACRDNPLANQEIRIVDGRSASRFGRGLRPVQLDQADVATEAGLYLAYATSPNNVADDGEGRHSPFTAAFLEHVTTAGEPIDTIMTAVKQSVGEATNWSQTPWTNSSMVQGFHFNGDVTKAELAVTASDREQQASRLLGQGRQSDAIAVALTGLPSRLGPDLPQSISLLRATLSRAYQSRTRTLTGHLHPIRYVAFSEDGSRVLTASRDTVRIWESATGTQLTSIDVSTQAAVYGIDGPVVLHRRIGAEYQIVDAGTGNVVTILPGSERRVTTNSAFSPDGRRLLTFDSSSNGYIWDASSGELLNVLEANLSRQEVTAWSRDASLVAVGHEDGATRVWDVRTGESLAVLQGPDSEITSVSISPDGRHLATTGSRAAARQWTLDSGGELVRTYGNLTADTVRFSPDGSRLLTVHARNTGRMWNAESGEELYLIESESGIFNPVFSPNRERIVAVTSTGVINTWSASSGELLQSLEYQSSRFLGPFFDPSGSVLATISGSTHLRLDSDVTQSLSPIDSDTVNSGRVAYSPDGRRIVSAAGATGFLWDTESRRTIGVLEGHTAPYTLLRFDASGTRLLTGSSDLEARIWELESGQLLATLRGHDDTLAPDPAEGVSKPPDEAGNFIIDAAFLPDGKRVVTAARRDTIVRIWDAATGRQLMALAGHEGRVFRVAVSRDGSRMLTSSDDGTARLWDTVDGREIAVLVNLASAPGAVFNSVGDRAIVLGADGTTRIFAASSGNLIESNSQEGRARRMRLARAGSSMFLELNTQSDGTLRLIDAVTGEELGRTGVINAQLRDIVISPDGTRILSSTYGETQLWDAASGMELATLDGHTLSDLDFAFSPDGTKVLTVARGGPVLVWNIGPYDEYLLDAAYTSLHQSKREQVDRERIRYWSFSPPAR